MDDEDGRCLLDVICDPEALNDFLHGSETHGHVSEVQPTTQLSANEPAGLPRVSVDLDFLEDDDILGGSPGGESGSTGIGTNHEPCDILQQSLAEANITEQSLQEAEAELDLGSFGIPGLTQVVQTLPDASLSGASGTAVGVGIGVGGAGTIFTGAGPSSTVTPPNAAADMLGSVLAQQGLQLQPQVMNKAISVQPFMQPVGLGNVTLQPISSLHTLPNGSQSGLGIGPIQVVGQPTVMTINQSGQPILAKAMGGYQIHQSGPEISGAGSQASLGNSGSGLLIQGNKATLGSPALNGPAVCVSNTNNSSSSSGTTVTAPAGLVGFGNTSLTSGIAPQTQTQGQIMQIIQRTPTPIQPKPPQGGAIQPKLFKPQPPQPTPQHHQNDAHKALGLQQIPVSAAQNVAFLTGKPGSNVVLSAPATSQAPQFQQTLFKQQATQPSGKPLSVHLLNQSGSIVLQGQNPQFVQLQAGGQILTQHPGGHIITSQGPGGQLIANQILTTNQNINLGQVLTSQGPTGAAHILSGPIQLQPGQMGTPTLFQMPVSLAQTHNQAQTHTVTGHTQTVIQGMPIQNPLMLGQVEGLSPAVSLQTNIQPQTGGVPSSSNSNSTASGITAPGQPADCVTVLGNTAEKISHPTQIHVPQPSVVAMQPLPSASSATTIPSSSPSISVSSTMPTMGLVSPQAQQNQGRLVFTNQGSSMILSQESLQMFLQQEPQHHKEKESSPSVGVPASVIVSSNNISVPALAVHDSHFTESWVNQSPSPGPSHLTAVVKQVPSTGHQQPLKIQNMCPSPAMAAHPTAQRVSESPQPSLSPLTLSQQMQSPHQQQSRPPSQPQPQNQTPSRACTPSHPPLFIIQNQTAESPQQTSQPQASIQVQLQPQPATHSVPHQQEIPSVSQSPKPPSAPVAQHQFGPVSISAASSTVVKAQVPIAGLSAEQQHHLQLVTAQIQTLSAITQPSPQQKQLLEKLHQVHQTIVLQSKQPSRPQIQPQATSHFSSQQDVPLDKGMSSSSAGLPAQIPSVLQPTSVVVKTPATGASDLQVFSGAQGPAGVMLNQNVTPISINQPAQVQPKPGVISSVGGMTLGKGGVQIQVLGTGQAQMPAPQPPAAVQTHTTIKMPFTAEPSKEARLLEQLRKQQGSVLHPNYSAAFNTFDDTLQRLLPYHLYQGNIHSSEDYEKVDEEFEKVSSMLLKRTQAMVDKYRHLLFSDSKQRLGPSAEMVMIDRMFIQEEKVALSQDRILAKERPEEFLASVRKWESASLSIEKSSTSSSGSRGAAPSPAPAVPVSSAPTPNVTPKPPTPPAPVNSAPLSHPVSSPAPVPPVPAPVPLVPAPVPHVPAPAPHVPAPIPPVPAPAPHVPAPVPPVPASAPLASAPAPVPTSVPASAPTLLPAASASPFPPTKLVIKQGGAGASVSWSTSCPTPLINSTKSVTEPIMTSSSSYNRASASSSSHFSSSPFNSKISDDDDALLQRTSKPPIKTYEARRRIGLKLKIKQDQTGFSKVVHNTALDPVHTPQSQHSSQSPQPASTQPNSVVQDSKSHLSSTPTVIRTQTPVCTSSSSVCLPSVSTQSNPELRSNSTYKQPPSAMSNPSVQMNGTVEHHSGGGAKNNPAAMSTSSQTTCRLPLRKTYRENVSPRVRPGIPGGGDESYPRTTDSPSSHKSSSPPLERTVIASVKVEKRDKREQVYRESSNDVGRLESAMHGLDCVDEVFSRNLKTSQHNVSLSDMDCSKDRQGEHTNFETGESKYKKMKNRQRAGGTFRMDQHAPGPPSPESYTRDPLLPAKRCKSDSPDMDNASFSSGSPPDDSLNEHLQCAIDSILNLQQEPTGHGPHIKGRSHHDHHIPGISASLSHRPSVMPSASASSLASHPQVRGRGHNGSLVPQTQSR